VRILGDDQLAGVLEGLGQPEPRVVVPGNCATPTHLVGIVDRSLERYRLFSLNAQHGLPQRPGVVHETPFIGPAVRDQAGLAYIPMRLSLVPRLFAAARPPDVVLLHTSPPRHNTVSLGIEVNILPAAVERVRARGGLVIAQVNPAMPYTFGDAELDLEAVDIVVEAEEALHHPTVRAADALTEHIGRLVGELVPDGATLQVGIGQVPDATVTTLHDRSGLSVWSEMISDGVLALERSGAMRDDRPLRSSFVAGSRDLYDWCDANPRLEMVRTERSNDPSLIASMPAMTSINTALQVDLFDQANASYVKHRVFSGFGGQTDFIVGALHCGDGLAVVALPSWHEKSASSTIVPLIDGPVTSFQHSVIVTEQGRAQMFGLTRQMQGRQLIEHAAHPDARDQLIEAAARLGIGAEPGARSADLQ